MTVTGQSKQANSYTFILLDMLSDMCSANHNEKSQQSFATVFSRQLHVLGIMCWKLVFDVLLCICINDGNVSMAYVCFKCNYCKGEYQTLRAYQCHRWHQQSVQFQEANIQYPSLNEGTYRLEYYMTIRRHTKVTQCRMSYNLQDT